MLDPRLQERLDFDLEKSGAVLVGAGYIGSKSHNTYVPPTDPDSIDDVDVFGIILPPVDYLIGLKSWEHQVIKHEELDAVFFSFHKTVRLLQVNNPNTLGFLWLRPEDYFVRTPILDLLLENRDLFSSQAAGQSFAGYARSQLQKMTSGKHEGYMGEKRKRLVERHGYDTKNASHLLRLLRMGTEFLNTGAMKVYRDEDADFFRGVKKGEYSLSTVQAIADDWFRHFQEARAKTLLPDKPDLDGINNLVVQVVQQHICGSR